MMTTRLKVWSGISSGTMILGFFVCMATGISSYPMRRYQFSMATNMAHTEGRLHGREMLIRVHPLLFCRGVLFQEILLPNLETVLKSEWDGGGGDGGIGRLNTVGRENHDGGRLLVKDVDLVLMSRGPCVSDPIYHTGFHLSP